MQSNMHPFASDTAARKTIQYYKYLKMRLSSPLFTKIIVFLKFIYLSSSSNCPLTSTTAAPLLVVKVKANESGSAEVIPAPPANETKTGQILTKKFFLTLLETSTLVIEILEQKHAPVLTQVVCLHLSNQDPVNCQIVKEAHRCQLKLVAPCFPSAHQHACSTIFLMILPTL